MTTALLLAACSARAPQSASTNADPPTVTSAETAPAETPTQEATEAPTATPAEAEAEATVTAQPVAEPSPAAPRMVQFTIVPEESTAGYSIQEVFISDNNTLATAVGVTSLIEGGMTLNYDDPAASEFEPFVVDISTLTSDRSRRDRAIRRQWLESSTYPLATFAVKEVRGFPADPQEGSPVSFQMVGDMTVKETTREVVWDVSAVLEGERLTGTATLDTFLADFDIPVPSIAGVLRVTDGIRLTLDFVMQVSEE